MRRTMPFNVLLRVRFVVMPVVAAAIFSSAVASAQERPVVFVHGLRSDGSAWRDAANRLQAALHMRARTPDLSAGALYEVQADQLAADTAPLGHGVVAIGHSNGGVVARQLSVNHPVSALVTIGTPHRGAPVVPNIATYTGLNLTLLGSISDVYRLFGSGCCNWQWLVTAYSVWWNLAYDLASSSLGQVIASLGVTVAQPVLPEMVPGSTYLQGINSTANLVRESIVMPTRVGIVSTARNFYWGGVMRAGFPDNGDELAYWRDVARVGMDYAANYLLAHADYGDWMAFEIADGLLQSSFFLGQMDEWWCQAVSVTGFGQCWMNDTLVPEWSQAYPAGISLWTGMDGPAHMQQTRMSDALLHSVLTTFTSIPPRSEPPPPPPLPPLSPPPPPPPPEVEAVFYTHTEFQGDRLAAGGDLSYVGSAWNDRISSLRAPQGRTVVLYEHADYRGASLTLSGDEVDLRRFAGPGTDGTWNDAVSSIRVF